MGGPDVTESRRVAFASRRARELAPPTEPIAVVAERPRAIPAWGHALMLAPAAVGFAMLIGYLSVGSP